MDDAARRRLRARHLRPRSGRPRTSRQRRRRRSCSPHFAPPTAGRSTPVNAWWGTFDLAVSLFSGRSVDPPSNDFIMRNSANAEQIEDRMVARRRPLPPRCVLRVRRTRPRGLRERRRCHRPPHDWDTELGEYILDWDDVRRAHDPHETAVEFGRSVIRHACAVCGWDQNLAASAEGIPPPVT